MVSVYVSSTYRDLKAYRNAVIGALRRMRHHVICMEDYGAADHRPLDKCLADVDQCEVYVGLFAWQYGYTPQEGNPAGRSITELEYRRALERKKQCLIFLLQDDQPWPPPLMDNGLARERLKVLRTELCKRHLVDFFRNENHLAELVATAVFNIAAPTPPASPSPTPVQQEERAPGPTGLQRAFNAHSANVECVALSADARKAASGSWDKTVCVWDLESGRMLARLRGHTGTIAHPGIVYRVAFAPNGSSVTSCGHDGTIRIWDLAMGHQSRLLQGHEGSVTALALSGDGQRIVSGGEDRMLRVWQLDTFREVYTLKGHRGPIRSLAVSADGKLAVSAGGDGQLRLWDLAGGREIPRFQPGRALLSVDLSPDGGLALSADIDGNICLWRVDSGIEVRCFSGHSKAVRTAVMSADLRRMLSGSNDGTMRLWDLSSGREIARYEDHKCAVVAVAVSADASVAVSGGADYLVRLWRLPQ